METETFNEKYNIFDKDSKAGTWIDKDVIPFIFSDLFLNQDKWIYMAGEYPDTRNPVMKDNALDYIYDTVQSRFSWLVYVITESIIDSYSNESIDMTKECAQKINDFLGEEKYKGL